MTRQRGDRRQKRKVDVRGRQQIEKFAGIKKETKNSNDKREVCRQPGRQMNKQEIKCELQQISRESESKGG